MLRAFTQGMGLLEEQQLPPTTSSPTDAATSYSNTTVSLEENKLTNATNDYPPGPDDIILRISLYSVLFVFAVVGNILVILTLVQNKRMRTVTNVFLLNLAVSDLLLGVFCMPFTLVGSLLRNFVFGELMCKLIPYLQAVSVSVSVWTLVSISMERFFAIMRPLQSRRWQTISHAYRVIVVIWTLSLIHVVPIALLSQLIPMKVPGRNKCREQWPSDVAEKGFNLYLDSVLLILPLLIMVVVYAVITRTLCLGIHMEQRQLTTGIPMKAVYREKASGVQCSPSTESRPVSMSRDTRMMNGIRQGLVVRGSNPEKSQAAIVRVIRMLFVVVIEFFVCWTPLYVVHTWSLYDPEFVYDALGPTGVSVVQLLAYASSCSNPITYCFMHQKFREGFLAAAGCRRGCCFTGTKVCRNCSAKASYATCMSTTVGYQTSTKKVMTGQDVGTV